MPRWVRAYVRLVERFNRFVGRFVMYLVFAMMGVLLFSSLSRGIFSVSHIWVVEMAQFLLAGYYLLGGAYSMQLDSHVRMDLLYSRWSYRTRALADMATTVFLLYYLCILLAGGLSSAEYALQYGQKNYSAWAPPLAPIKIAMCIGIGMMILQSVACFFRDLGAWLGRPIPESLPEAERVEGRHAA